MRNFLDKLANWLFDMAEMAEPKWYHRPVQVLATGLLIGYMVGSELVTGKSFFYGNYPPGKDENNGNS